MARSLLCVVAWVACVAATGASPPTVKETRGHSVYLPCGMPVGPDVAEVTWRLLSPRRKIVTYSNKNIEYYGSEEYKRRITFHPGNFSLEIHDLRREDAGDYEVTVTASSGAYTQEQIRLEVDDLKPSEKSSHTAWIIPVVVILILILVCCIILYVKRQDLHSHWDKHMGKKSNTSDEPAVTESLNSRPGGERSS